MVFGKVCVDMLWNKTRSYYCPSETEIHESLSHAVGFKLMTKGQLHTAVISTEFFFLHYTNDF